ncbi:hypothetical protein NK6_7165 [Bradyrhizobium diazoefficiens]|uniref:Uncharacterized protein n=1 Tax=Bradyrhizobium diazoefficiens TaxID=1355477 RepID=A0A0E4FWV6_9BRAD|nr:hypothetical protein NK6_7165 [Bradyrhizobium diazoefficiens]
MGEVWVHGRADREEARPPCLAVAALVLLTQIMVCYAGGPCVPARSRRCRKVTSGRGMRPTSWPRRSS